MTEKNKKEIEEIRVKLDALIKAEAKLNGCSRAWHSLVASKDALGFALLDQACSINNH